MAKEDLFDAGIAAMGTAGVLLGAFVRPGWFALAVLVLGFLLLRHRKERQRIPLKIRE